MSKNESGRENFRVTDSLLFSIDVISKEEFDRIKADSVDSSTFLLAESSKNSTQIGGNFSDGELYQLHNHLVSIDNKINILLSDKYSKEVSMMGNKSQVDISYSGMSFKNIKGLNFEKGDYVRVVMVLPFILKIPVEFIARVVRLNSEEVAINFDFRCEEEELIISRYILKRQRDELKKRSGSCR